MSEIWRSKYDVVSRKHVLSFYQTETIWSLWKKFSKNELLGELVLVGNPVTSFVFPSGGIKHTASAQVLDWAAFHTCLCVSTGLKRH